MEYLTIEEAAVLVNRDPQSIASAIRDERIPAFMRHNVAVVRADDVTRWSDDAKRMHKVRYAKVTPRSGRPLPVLTEVVSPPPVVPVAVQPSLPIPEPQQPAASALGVEALIEIAGHLKTIAEKLADIHADFPPRKTF